MTMTGAGNSKKIIMLQILLFIYLKHVLQNTFKKIFRNSRGYASHIGYKVDVKRGIYITIWGFSRENALNTPI